MESTIKKGKIKIPSIITVKKLADLLKLPVSQIIIELMKNKILATLNEEVDFETASIIAQDLGFETEEDVLDKDSALTLEELLEICKKELNQGENLQNRPPVVTILGHVDHGKTTLLDAIRKTNVVSGEAGGITQHIRAYQVKKKGEIITFIDTPGHEAFSAMRERGVSIADIAILVVAADDGVRPQTKEVIQYLKGKKVPTIVAINKVDKPEANIQRVKQELAENEILIEEWGGKVMCVEVSAKQNKGIDELLESVLLLSEVEDFKANNKRSGLAVVLESHLDPQKGPFATVLVKTGTLKVGQDILVGKMGGRIKKIEDFSGKSLPLAGPSSPVAILGISGVANVNDILEVVDREKLRMAVRSTEKDLARKGNVISRSSAENENLKKVKIILKADVQGSLEAIIQILDTIKSSEVALEYITREVGNITETDVKMAQSSGATIFGFNVIITAVAKRMAEAGAVTVKTYHIIYELVEEVKKMMASLLPPEIIRKDNGTLNVLAIFKTGKKDMIVGGRVGEGKAIKGSLVEIKRGGEIVGRGKLVNLQQNKQNATEVNQGNECGITFEGEQKIKEGDTLVFYQEEKKIRTL